MNNKQDPDGSRLAPTPGSAHLAACVEQASEHKKALKLMDAMAAKVMAMTSEQVYAELASLAEWQVAVQRTTHPDDRRSLLADILYVESLGSGEDAQNVEVSDSDRLAKLSAANSKKENDEKHD